MGAGRHIGLTPDSGCNIICAQDLSYDMMLTERETDLDRRGYLSLIIESGRKTFEIHAWCLHARCWRKPWVLLCRQWSEHHHLSLHLSPAHIER